MNTENINFNGASFGDGSSGVNNGTMNNNFGKQPDNKENKKSWWEKYGIATIIVAVIMVSGSIIVALINKDKLFSAEPAKTINVSFATSKNMWCGLGLIAYENGYFREEGLNVKISYLESGRYCLDALVSNSTDFATIVEVNISYFGFTGNKSVIDIASLVSSTSSGIIALKSRGINKPEDLKGKKLAFCPGTTSDIFANRFIEKHNIKATEVNFQKIQPLAISSAVISGSVDAASTWDPHIFNISKALGEDAIVFRDPDAYTGYLTLAVRKEWAYANKETVISFLKALRKADIFAKEHKAESQIIISKMINLDIEVVKATWDLHNMELKLDKDEMLKAVNSQGIWINQTMEEYKNKAIPNYTEYFDSKFLDELNSSK